MKRSAGFVGAALLALIALSAASYCSKNDTPTQPPDNATATATPTLTPGIIAPTLTPTAVASSPTPTRTLTPGPTGTPGPAAFAGNWTGSWVNNTFATVGAASLSVSVNTAAQSFQFTLALSGNVFGAGTPAPQTMSGTYTGAGATITGHSALFGDVTMSIGSNGALSGQAINVPSANISRIDFAGTATPQTITITYVITFNTSGIATGVLTLNHQ